jgi:DNA-binding MarR family transcriptional regulator
MNTLGDKDQDTYRSFLLMSEIGDDPAASQRKLAGRLGIAVGLVNSYLKTLVAKGYVTVRTMPRNRFAYLLTPKGFAEKSRLAFQHLGNYNKLYRVTRQESLSLFTRLREQGVEHVSFCGLDDFTEIAYLSLQEAGLQLEQVIDDAAGERFLDREVVPMNRGARAARGPIVITALQRAEELKRKLLALGVAEERILGPSLSFEEALARNYANLSGKV